MIRANFAVATSISRLRLPAMLLSIVCASGCSALDNCPDGRDPVSVLNGVTDKEQLIYESKPWGRDLDAFPAKTALYFRHDLGVIPPLVLPYLSFSPVGTANEGHGSVTVTSGNQTLIDCVDDRVIVLRNDTCEPSFYVRVVAMGESRSVEDDAKKPDCCATAPADLPACSD
jgi:hypothetical protein